MNDDCADWGAEGMVSLMVTYGILLGLCEYEVWLSGLETGCG